MKTLSPAGKTYQEYINQLKEKNGIVPYDYFTDRSCRFTNRLNSRYKEGLVIHHIDEDKYLNLSKDPLSSPLECQLKENLVYCNFYEHFYLHFYFIDGMDRGIIKRNKGSYTIWWRIKCILEDKVANGEDFLLPIHKNYVKPLLLKEEDLYIEICLLVNYTMN